MTIPQLLHELPLVSDIEIVISLLPEVFAVADQPPRHALLQRLDRIRQHSTCRFVQQQVNVFGHHDIRVDAERETMAHALQCYLERLLRCYRHKEWTATITGESNEVSLLGLLKAF